jgi:hypothetical protein
VLNTDCTPKREIALDNLIISAGTQKLAGIERGLARLLPGLDVRVHPVSRHRGVVMAPVLVALRTDYADVGLQALLTQLGASEWHPIDDRQSAVLLANRSDDDLPPRPAAARGSAAVRDWHLAVTRLPQAWALLGGPQAIAWGATRVAQMDTGYLQHPAFGFPNTWLDTANGRSFMPDPLLDAPGFDPGEPGGGVDRPGWGLFSGHGTRIGSYITGRDASAPGGAFHGAAPGVPLVPVRITDSVWINDRQGALAEGLHHAVATGVGAVNISLGIFVGIVEKALKDAIDAAYEAGVIVVCAAGNHVNTVVAPARLNRTVAVAGITRDERPWSGSSYGPQVDFSAPASDLWGPTVDKRGHFGWGGGKDGTSYATAITTGVAALWLTHRRGALLNAYGPPSWKWVEAFRRIAIATTRLPTNGPWEPGAFGKGILDAHGVLTAALPALTTADRDAGA